MLALGIHYLNGWAMAAADGANKEVAEWPPHPDRVFMALAAAWFETGEDPAEGEALRWLEALEDPPEIAASDAASRTTAGRGSHPPVSYVPVNDTRTRKPPADPDLALLPEHRGRQARQFPVAIPHRPLVHLIWPEADPGPYAGALANLARKVTHIGHSASFTQLWLDPSPPEPTWLPDKGLAARRLRITPPGRLDYLREQCNRAAVIEHADLQARMKAAKGKEKKLLKAQIEERFGDTEPVTQRPKPSLWQGYAPPEPEQAPALPGTRFDPRLLVFTLSGQRLPLPAILRLTNALRRTLLKQVDCQAGDIPEWLCGHALDGTPATRPHIAWVPLPFVDAEHADSHIMGAAMILPRELDPEETKDLLGPWLYDSETGLPREIKLFDGHWLKMTAKLDTRESRRYNLQSETWTAQDTGACWWASVTPVVLDRHFKGADKWEQAAESIEDACERIGLPRPEGVELHPVSWVRGAPRATEFPYLTRKRDGGRMYHAHACLRFDKPVCGPILIGAGRFRGYGLCRPLNRCVPLSLVGGKGRKLEIWPASAAYSLPIATEEGQL